ncbi:DUF6000 family protein [Ornithinimicrobium sp. W1679]|uniref:DUF6000 family protein n=1 Tax=Ornithinimicrobium sp. W1679 TaxID=3418770 RepID=UPI003CE9CD67
MRPPNFDRSQKLEDDFGDQNMAEYVHPYYLSLMSFNATRAEPSMLEEVRVKARKLSQQESAMLLGMHWRARVMGAWYATAINSSALAPHIHESLETSLGHLTSPPLIIAAVRLPTARTAELLDDYGRTDETHQWGAAPFAKAASAWLMGRSPEEATGDAHGPARLFQSMMDVGAKLAGGPANGERRCHRAARRASADACDFASLRQGVEEKPPRWSALESKGREPESDQAPGAAISFMLAGQQFKLSDTDVRTGVAKSRPDQIYQYWVDIDGTRWPVKQVLALATGLANSEFQSQSAQRLLAKLGFTIGKGNDVVAVPAGTARSSSPATTPSKRSPAPTAADVVLIGCVKSKQASGALAKDLYTSNYFAKMRAYAESTGKPWYILSAEHGLVAPDDWLEPYDCYLAKTGPAYQQDWGRKVARQLEEALGPLEGRIFDIHAGSTYVKAVDAAVSSKGAVLLDQLKGMSIGQRLSWYLHQPTPSTDDSTAIAAQLSDQSQARTLDDVLSTSGNGLRSPGLYSWWVDDCGARDLSAGLEHQIAPGLIYAGLAGATRKSGASSSNTLWGRISTMHLGKKNEFSTLRRSLGSILAHANGQPDIDEARLTLWMHAHLRVVLIPVANPDTLDALETNILSELDPPLNLAKVARTPLRQRLSELRKQYAH